MLAAHRSKPAPGLAQTRAEKPLDPNHRSLHALVSVALLICVASAGGCGAVTTQQGLGEAKKQIDEATKLQAEEFAPYEYTRATAYYTKAKKLTGEGYYEQAAEYAKLAQLAAEKALDVARLGKERKDRLERFAPQVTPQKVPSPLPTAAPGTAPVAAPAARGGQQ